MCVLFVKVGFLLWLLWLVKIFQKLIMEKIEKNGIYCLAIADIWTLVL